MLLFSYDFISKCDFIVLEAGVGGEYDATSVLKEE